MAIKNQRDAIRRHVNAPCTAKHRTWVVTGIKKDGTAAKRWYKLTFVSESGFYAFLNCDILGYKVTRCTVRQLVNTLDALKQGVKVSGSLRKDGTPSKRRQLMIFINESGFYALVLGSKLPTAVKFKNWVIFDVLLQLKYPNLRIFRGFCNMNLRIFVYFMEILSGTNADGFWQ